MQYQILGETMPAVRILLDAGESVYTQSGGMTSMQDGITMETNMRGGMPPKGLSLPESMPRPPGRHTTRSAC